MESEERSGVLALSYTLLLPCLCYEEKREAVNLLNNKILTKQLKKLISILNYNIFGQIFQTYNYRVVSN